MLASLGCGNPTALAKLNPGEIVLDLGSGGGIDVLLSARRVGPTGKAYGLDMTDEMLALARENQRKAGVANVEFLKGEIENDPAAGQLRGRHHLQLRHQPLGRQGPRACAKPSACSSPAADSPCPTSWCAARFRRTSAATSSCGSAAWRARWRSRTTCEARARPDSRTSSIEPTRVYRIEDARAFLSGHGIDVDAIAPLVDGRFMSAFIRATKAGVGVTRAACVLTRPSPRPVKDRRCPRESARVSRFSTAT